MRTACLTSFLVFTLLLFAAMPLWADGVTLTQCPNFQPLPQPDEDNNAFNGCSALITLNPNGAKSLTFNPQSDVEDMLVGVVNNSGHTIYSITIKGEEPFEFDHDFGLGSGETGYEGPGISFTVFHSGLGIVHFDGGLPNGGTAYFGLEGAPNHENVQVVPEPSSLMLLGTGIVGILGRMWKKLL